ncbi:MAG: dockerin type I repeat-containing protein [bacterium]
MKNPNSTTILTLLLCLVLAVSLALAGDKTKSSQPKAVTSEKQELTASTTATPPASTTTEPTPPVSQSPAAPMSGEEINWQVISGGGTNASSANFLLMGTLAQTAVGGATSANYSVDQGYWQSFGCCDKRGDVDNTGSIDVGDLTYLVAYLFQGGPPPPCEDEGDVDGTGSIDVGDLTYLVAYLFQGGPPPPGC